MLRWKADLKCDLLGNHFSQAARRSCAVGGWRPAAPRAPRWSTRIRILLGYMQRDLQDSKPSRVIWRFSSRNPSIGRPQRPQREDVFLITASHWSAPTRCIRARLPPRYCQLTYNVQLACFAACSAPSSLRHDRAGQVCKGGQRHPHSQPALHFIT